jgi:hypothetical protein
MDYISNEHSVTLRTGALLKMHIKITNASHIHSQ